MQARAEGIRGPADKFRVAVAIRLTPGRADRISRSSDGGSGRSGLGSWKNFGREKLPLAFRLRDCSERTKSPPLHVFRGIHDIQDLQLGRPSRAISMRKDLTQLSPPVRWFRLCRIPHESQENAMKGPAPLRLPHRVLHRHRSSHGPSRP